MIAVREIRNQLASYLANEITFEQFEDWLIIQSQNMHLDSSLQAQELVNGIEENIFQYLDDLMDELMLKSRLSPYIRTYAEVVTFPDAKSQSMPKVVSSASSQANFQKVDFG